MNLVILDTIFSVVKFPPTEEIPSWGGKGEFFSITRTIEELSILLVFVFLKMNYNISILKLLLFPNFPQ
ncbi:hypothetical protein [Bacillus sp. V2I10]|uniref:hypothetical protein n=1 Tax=Bacillus sp. V2I10 TaxID=3042276 RepID=UPI00278009ED|nr:hypothetical protein [Bacillus sp. V2I10]